MLVLQKKRLREWDFDWSEKDLKKRARAVAQKTQQ
jgi:hypothetical protein